jgi:hypothetical protein
VRASLLDTQPGLDEKPRSSKEIVVPVVRLVTSIQDPSFVGHCATTSGKNINDSIAKKIEQAICVVDIIEKNNKRKFFGL